MTAILITVTGIVFKQSALRILPLYISLLVYILKAQANRYANLIGGINALFYTVVYLYLGLYATAGYSALFSFPIQIATFIRWGKNKYGQSTVFRKMNGRERLAVSAGFLAAFAGLFAVLKAAGSSHQLLDNLSSLLGMLVSALAMLAYIEYTWLALPASVMCIALNIATMTTHPEQITYLISSVYSFLCEMRQFVVVRHLYTKQHADDTRGGISNSV